MPDAQLPEALPSPAPVLVVRDVTVRAHARLLLEGVTFEVTPGEVVAIIGPNGAGKTTLLEVITGMRELERGSVAFRGTSSGSFGERARHFSFLPDGGELPSELRVRGVVDHALRFRPRAPEVVLELARALETDSLLDAPVGVLSRGERQRVALFCALSVERPVVILDEPFDAFDPLKLRDVLAVVRRVASAGAAVVASVHHLADAAKIADRFLMLAEGRAIASGTLASLRDAAGVPGGSLEELFVALLSRGAHAS